MRKRLRGCFAGLVLNLLAGTIFPSVIDMTKLIEKAVQVGDSLNVPCLLETPGGSIQWIRNGKPLVLNNSAINKKYWNITTDNEVSLTISDTTAEDNGLWECREVGSDGVMIRTTKVLKLLVMNPPDDPFLEIEEKKLPSQATISVKELTLLSVKCVARHAVPPVEQIHWSLDTKNISSNSELLVEFLPEKNTYVSWSVVTFNVTRTFHKKDLVCYVHHELWPQAVTVSASLDVLYVPSFSISREPPFGFPVVEGMFVSLQCDIDANPPSVAKWLKDEGTLPLASSVDGVLNFTSISRHHSGWYKCITENQFGSFSSFGYFLNVRYGAEIVQEPPDVLEADAGDPFRLECKADGKPPPSYCWTRIRENSRLEGVSIEKDLLLDTVLYSDAGQYKCIASNTIGRRLYTAQTKDINVKVKGRPEVDPVNKTLNAIAGKSAKLFVRFCGNPRPYRAIWILRHLALSPGDTILPYIAHNATELGTPNCYLCALEITKVSPEDGGEILFFAKNPKGIDDAVILLNITQASFSVSSGLSVHERAVWKTCLTVVIFFCLIWENFRLIVH
ncbi:irregular chiasm C-roughest protein-like [Tachypleus tridentatus]|uniref:irregular chiasm C-roughest protein-like n=1 Tax=Tachypleus tridentatus TaxID=6853 RepID=UPI003FD69C5F